MNLIHLLTVLLLAGAVACFVSEAKSAPHLQAPVFSPLSLEAGSDCKRVRGQLVCGKQSNDRHHHGKGKKKNTDAPVAPCPKTQTEAATLREAITCAP